jgi:hypothetical protein
MKIEIQSAYHMSVTHRLELPDNKTWDDVYAWQFKWNMLRIKFEDGTEWEKMLDGSMPGITDGTTLPLPPGMPELPDGCISADDVETDYADPEWWRFPSGGVEIREVTKDENGEEIVDEKKTLATWTQEERDESLGESVRKALRQEGKNPDDLIVSVIPLGDLIKKP